MKRRNFLAGLITVPFIGIETFTQKKKPEILPGPGLHSFKEGKPDYKSFLELFTSGTDDKKPIKWKLFDKNGIRAKLKR